MSNVVLSEFKSLFTEPTSKKLHPRWWMLLWGFFIIVNCSEADDKPMNQASSDIDTLSRLISLPYPPLAVTWQTMERAPEGTGLGPKDWSLVAVITFAESHFQEILRQSSVSGQELPLTSLAPNLGDLMSEKIDEKWTSRSIKAREPDLFTKSPLLHGHLVPIDDHSRFFLSLHTM